MSDESYNGWTNWETWNVGLWLDGEEWSYLEAMTIAISEAGNKAKERLLRRLAKRTGAAKDDVDMDKVNWAEIREAYEAST